MNKTRTMLAIVAVLTAAVIVSATFASTPAFAHHRHHGCSNGSTCVSNNVRNSATASGGSTATATTTITNTFTSH